MTSHDIAVLAEDRHREMSVLADVGILARCVQCETPTQDATTCAICIEFGDPCLYCRGCVRTCKDCKELVCYEHTTTGSDRCRECTRQDDILTGDQA